MEFNTHALAKRHQKWVEAIFHYRDFVPDHSIERVVPTGHTFALFELDGFTRHTFNNETLQPDANFHKAWISGFRDEYLSISAHQRSEMLVVQFKPYGAAPFLHQPMSGIANRVVPGEDILDGNLLDLREKLLDAKSPHDKFALVELWLDEQYDDPWCPSDSLTGFVDKLSDQPTEPLAPLVERFDGTQKHLIDTFKRAVGCTPKTLQRVLRFNQVFTSMQAGDPVNWAGLAQTCGYADQSHFIREFRRFSGFNPAEFQRSGIDNNEGNFFPLDG